MTLYKLHDIEKLTNHETLVVQATLVMLVTQATLVMLVMLVTLVMLVMLVTLVTLMMLVTLVTLAMIKAHSSSQKNNTADTFEGCGHFSLLNFSVNLRN